MEFYDFACDSDNDLIISGGDFKIIESSQQHVKDILLASKGNYRQWPLLGMGINNFVNSSIDPREFTQRVKIALSVDNYRVDKVIVDNDFNIQIDAEKIK